MRPWRCGEASAQVICSRPGGDPGDAVRLAQDPQHRAEAGPGLVQLGQRVRRAQLQALARGPGQQLADAVLLAMEGLRIRPQHPVLALEGAQQVGAAPDLGRDPPAQPGPRRRRAALAQLLQPGQVQGRGEPFRGPRRQVVRLVHQHDPARAVLRRAEQPGQGRVGREHVVVVADHHVGPGRRVQRQLERAEQVAVGLLGQVRGGGAAPFSQARQGARVLAAGRSRGWPGGRRQAGRSTSGWGQTRSLARMVTERTGWPWARIRRTQSSATSCWLLRGVQ